MHRPLVHTFKILNKTLLDVMNQSHSTCKLGLNLSQFGKMNQILLNDATLLYLHLDIFIDLCGA
jgi:hypothetical protein